MAKEVVSFDYDHLEVSFTVDEECNQKKSDKAAERISFFVLIASH